MIIAYKLSSNRGIDLVIYCSICAHVVCYFTGITGLFPLLIHSSLEAILVYLVSLFLQDLFCQIQRESISIIQLECIGTGKCLLPCLIHILFHVAKDTQTLVNGLIELILFISKYPEDEILLFFQLRISVLGTIDHCPHLAWKGMLPQYQEGVHDGLHGGSDGEVHSLFLHW